MLASVKANIVRSDENMTELEKAKVDCACALLQTVVAAELLKKVNAQMTEQQIVDKVCAIINAMFDELVTP